MDVFHQHEEITNSAKTGVIPNYFELIEDYDNEYEEEVWEWMCRTLPLFAEELVRARVLIYRMITPIQLQYTYEVSI